MGYISRNSAISIRNPGDLSGIWLDIKKTSSVGGATTSKRRHQVMFIKVMNLYSYHTTTDNSSQLYSLGSQSSQSSSSSELNCEETFFLFYFEKKLFH